LGRFVRSISILKSLHSEAVDVAKSGKYPGISDFSSIVEFALDRLLHPEKYFPSNVLDELEVTQIE